MKDSDVVMLDLGANAECDSRNPGTIFSYGCGL